MNLLDCETYDSTLKCFAKLHEVSQDEIVIFIKNQTPDELEKACKITGKKWDDVLYGRWLNAATPPRDWEETCWFHATRLFDDHTIMENGLLPLSSMKEKLWAKLREISQEEIDDGAWKNFVRRIKSSSRYKTKQHKVAEGPFAFLIFEPLEHYSSQDAASRDYFQGSELVENICFGKDKDIGGLLWKKYLAETSPYAVKFTAPRQNYEMEVVLHYLWVKEWEPDEIKTSVNANTCFLGYGNLIDSDKILNIIEVDY